MIYKNLKKRNLKILLCAVIIIYAVLAQGILNFSVYAKTDNNNNSVIFTENNIKTEDMRKKSNFDEKNLTKYLEKYPNLSGIEQTLIEIQDEYEVNAILILAIVRLESGNGKSSIAKSRNNLGGIIVMEKSVRVYKSFDSKSDCVVYMAKLLSKSYLTEDGRYFNGYTLEDIAKRYSASPEKWTELVEELIYEIQVGIDKI